MKKTRTGTCCKHVDCLRRLINTAPFFVAVCDLGKQKCVQCFESSHVFDLCFLIAMRKSSSMDLQYLTKSLRGNLRELGAVCSVEEHEDLLKDILEKMLGFFFGGGILGPGLLSKMPIDLSEQKKELDKDAQQHPLCGHYIPSHYCSIYLMTRRWSGYRRHSPSMRMISVHISCTGGWMILKGIFPMLVTCLMCLNPLV